jgi:hypothetical protein
MEFIIPLVLAIGLITALALFLLGLVSASWQVLLVILIVGLVLTRKLIQQADSPAPAVSIKSKVAEVEIKDQGFVYRGVCYEKDGCLKTDEGKKKEEFAGKYRGINCTYVKQEKQIPSTKNTRIKYRGASLGSPKS